MSPSDRRTLWLVLGLAALADALLAPFYPQFFAAAFASSSLFTPAAYIALSRTAVAVTLPLWTRWTRRVSPLRLVAIAQGVAGCAGLACAAAPDLKTFLALSFVTEAARTSYLLLYPTLVQGAAPARRGRVVVHAATLMSGAAIVAALVGGVLLEHAGGRAALVLAAAIDFVQLALLLPLVRRAAAPAPEPESAPEPSAAPAPAAAWPLWALATIGFATTFAVVLLRPFFTLFVQLTVAPAAPLWLLGAVFVVPSVVAVAAMPLVRRWLEDGRLAAHLALAIWLLALTSWLHFVSAELAALVVVRLAYGLVVYAVDVGLDHATLCGARGDGFGRFGWVHALQNAAIVAAPFAAGLLAGELGFPALFACAALVAAAAAAIAGSVRRAAAAPSTSHEAMTSP